MATQRTRLTPEMVRDTLSSVASLVSPVQRINPRVWAYYKAAAVLTSFNPAELRPVGESAASRGDALRSLVSDCVPEVAEVGVAWRLRGDVRRFVLQQMVPKELSDALDLVSSRLDNPLATAFRVLTTGVTLSVFQRTDDLQRALVVADWLGLDESIRRQLRKRLEFVELMQPFNDLVGDHFRGREDELRTLSDYVGVTSRSFGAELKRRIQRAGALAVVGPGGVGKSTLIARFILDHAEAAAEGGLAFAYLDADRPTVLPEDPRSLLMEVGRQLSIQFPDASIDLQALQDEMDAAEKQSTQQTAGAVRLASVEQLGIMLKRIGRPFLLVLDTFEEIQYRSSDFVHAIGVFLEELSAAWPNTRTVIASRAPILEFKTQSVSLGAFDEAAAIGFLMHRQVRDEALAKTVFSQLGGNPLTLRLAADLINSDESEGLQDVKSISKRNLLLLRLDERAIQGQLYRRILNHIKDETVKKLAHPGLVVRRVTPAVILRVLAQPCGLDIASIEDARDVFQRLAREVSLVERDGDGLRHLGYLRKVMLRLLIADEPAKVKAIHEGAVEYYRKEKGSRARAEELYHRLMLGQPSSEIDQRWRDELKGYLAGSLDELPPVSRAYLATKLGYEIDDATRKQAETAVWERAAVTKAQDLLDLDRPQDALNVLQERPERSEGSAIYALEVEALRGLNRLTEAVGVVERGLPSIRMAGDPARFIELAELGAAAAEQLGDLSRAINLLESASVVARSAGSTLGRLSLAIRLYTVRGASSSAPRPAELEQLIALYRNTPRPELLSDEFVVTEIAAIIADRLPSALADAVEVSANGWWSDRWLSALANYVQRRTRKTEGARVVTLDSIARELDELRIVRPSMRARRIHRLLRRFLDVEFPTGSAATDLARLIRSAILQPETEDEASGPRLTVASRSRRASSRRKLKK